jgi:hypothetical protein
MKQQTHNRAVTVAEMLANSISTQYRRDRAWSVGIRVLSVACFAAGVALAINLIICAATQRFSFTSLQIPLCALLGYAGYECRELYVRRRIHQKAMLERLRTDPVAIRAALDLLHSEQDQDIITAAMDAIRLHLQHPPELELSSTQARALSRLLYCSDAEIVRLVPHAIAVMGDKESVAELGTFVPMVNNDSVFVAEVLSARDFLLQRLEKKSARTTLLRHVSEHDPEDEATLMRASS